MKRKYYRLNEAPNLSCFSQYDILHLIETGEITPYASLEAFSATLYAGKKTIGVFDYKGIVKISKNDALQAFEKEKTWIESFQPIDLKNITSFKSGPISNVVYPNDFFEGYFNDNEKYNLSEIRAYGKISQSQKGFLTDKLNEIPQLNAVKPLVSRMKDIVIIEIKLLKNFLRFDLDEVLNLAPKATPEITQNKLKELLAEIVKTYPKISIGETWKILKQDSQAQNQEPIFDHEGIVLDVFGNSTLTYTNDPSSLDKKGKEISRNRVANLLSEIRNS